jgi:4-deoxy-L-threo-5-hexosulose-uronate ketol-isomerase
MRGLNERRTKARQCLDAGLGPHAGLQSEAGSMSDSNGMKFRPSTDRDGLRRMTAQDIRDTFVIGDLFQPGKISMTYVEVDRAVVGSAMPLDTPLPLPSDRRLATGYFCERREIGVINIGGPGWISLDGARHDLDNLDSLYIGRGVESVAFASTSAAAPAKFYFVSYPAHAAHPSRVVRKAEARVIQAGDQKTANRRTIRQSIRPGIVDTCQLVMGFTELESGNVWNTMPPHTHGRRSEIYMYFDAAPARVMHIMGEPSEPRTVFMDDGEAVFSPSWSMHSGVGTADYRFVWSMGGENLDFDDMDHLTLADLR